jgi:hypothetical protein
VVRSRAAIFGDFLSNCWRSVNYLVPCDTKDVLFSFSQMFLSSVFFGGNMYAMCFFRAIWKLVCFFISSVALISLCMCTIQL